MDNLFSISGSPKGTTNDFQEIDCVHSLFVRSFERLTEFAYSKFCNRKLRDVNRSTDSTAAAKVVECAERLAHSFVTLLAVLLQTTKLQCKTSNCEGESPAVSQHVKLKMKLNVMQLLALFQQRRLFSVMTHCNRD